MDNSINQQYKIAFGAHLKATRSRKKITQATLAARSGVSLSHLSRMEVGKRGPTLNVLYALAKALRLHPKKLLEFDFNRL